MDTLNELRKAIKSIGFGVRTKQNSFGGSATYYHIETGEKLNSNVFTAEKLLLWKPLFDFRKANNESLKRIRIYEDCTGLV